MHMVITMDSLTYRPVQVVPFWFVFLVITAYGYHTIMVQRSAILSIKRGPTYTEVKFISVTQILAVMEHFNMLLFMVRIYTSPLIRVKHGESWTLLLLTTRPFPQWIGRPLSPLAKMALISMRWHIILGNRAHPRWCILMTLVSRGDILHLVSST